MKKAIWIICAAALIIVIVLFAFTNQRNTLQDQISALESENASFAEKLYAAEESLKTAEAELETLRQESEAAAAAAEQQLADKAKEMEDALAVAAAEKDTAVSDAIAAAALEKETAVNDAVAAAEAEKDQVISELKTQAEASSAEIDAMQAEIAGKDSQIEALNAEIEQAKADAEAASAEIDAMNTEIADKDTQIASLNAEIEQAKADAEAASAEIESMKAEIVDKDTQIEALNAEIEQVKADAEAEKQTAIEEAVEKAVAAAKDGMVTVEEKAAAVAEAVKDAVADMIPTEEHQAEIKAEVEKAVEDVKAKYEEEKQAIIEKAQEGLYTLEQVKEQVTQGIEDALRQHGILKDDENTLSAIPSLASYTEQIVQENEQSVQVPVLCALSYMMDVLPQYGFGEISPEGLEPKDGVLTLSSECEGNTVACTITVSGENAKIEIQCSDELDVQPYEGDAPDLAALREKYADVLSELFPETSNE